MSGISEVEPGRFRVEFARLGQGGGLAGRLKAMLASPASQTVDLFRIGQAVCEVMALSRERDVDGTLLAWNEYRIYLSRADHERLRALQARLQDGLNQRIREQLQRMEARTIGDPIVRVMVDEETDLPRGVGEVLVSYVSNATMAPPADGQVTVRVSSSSPRPMAAPPVPEEGTIRVDPVQSDAASGEGIWLRWSGGEALVPLGSRVQVGRPHERPPASFVALTGASNRINSAHFHLEADADGVVLSRPIRSNPVTVGGRMLQPGGRMVLAELPVEVQLANGELSVTVERA